MENIANHLDFLIEKWQKMIENQKISLNHISIKKYEKNPENEKSEKKELEYKGGIQIEEPKEKNIIARNVK